MQKLKQKEKMDYINIFESKLQARVNFLARLQIKNIINKEVVNFNNNIEYLVKNDYLYLVYNSIALQKKFEFGNEHIGIFLTQTLDSSFHKFRQLKSGKLVKNEKFLEGNTTNLGYKILTNFFKGIYKDFKVNNKFIKVEYVRVIEPHSDFTPHLHAIIFIQKAYLEQFKNHFERKVSLNKNLGINKFEVIENISRSASYILKYAKKNFESSNDNYKVYYGWRLAHKIRAYTFTRQFIPRDLFNKLSFHLSKDFALDIDSFDEFATNNFYEIVHKFTQLQQNTIDIFTGEINSKNKEFDEDDMFIVRVQKKRRKIENCENHKIIEIEKVILSSSVENLEKELEKYNLLNSFNYFVKNVLSLNCMQLEPIVYIFYVDIFLKTLANKRRYSYKIDDYQIFKKHFTNARYDLVFDKKDWKLEKSNSLQ